VIELKRWLLFSIVTLLGVFALYGFVEMNWSYSTGERAGWIQKFSRKGWLCKTWEGEMAMVTMPGTVPEKFTFTVWDDRVVEQINRSMGQRVSLSYEQKKGLPSSCFGDTEYWITALHVLPDVPPAPGAVPYPGAAAPGVAPAPGAAAPGAAPAPGAAASGGVPAPGAAAPGGVPAPGTAAPGAVPAPSPVPSPTPPPQSQ
jgi:hypothetical protein